MRYRDLRPGDVVIGKTCVWLVLGLEDGGRRFRYLMLHNYQGLWPHADTMSSVPITRDDRLSPNVAVIRM